MNQTNEVGVEKIYYSDTIQIIEIRTDCRFNKGLLMIFNQSKDSRFQNNFVCTNASSTVSAFHIVEVLYRTRS